MGERDTVGCQYSPSGSHQAHVVSPLGCKMESVKREPVNRKRDDWLVWNAGFSTAVLIGIWLGVTRVRLAGVGFRLGYGGELLRGAVWRQAGSNSGESRKPAPGRGLRLLQFVLTRPSWVGDYSNRLCGFLRCSLCDLAAQGQHCSMRQRSSACGTC